MKYSLALAVVASLSFSGAALADTVTINGAPDDGFHYGNGNDYPNANALILDTTAGDEFALRFHKTFQVAPASIGNVYTFALGTTPLSFDWSIDVVSAAIEDITASLTLTRYGAGGGTFSYNPFFVGNDNDCELGSCQNSFRFTFPVAAAVNFDPSVNATYGVSMKVNGVVGGPKQLNAYAVYGTGTPGFTPGGAVPEPGTWALMILGFGGAGAMLRNRNRRLLAA